MNPLDDGIRLIVVDAQRQARTPRDVKGPWVRPKVPPKRAGRKGTRRRWKQLHPPGWAMYYREPTDVLLLTPRTAIVTPRQEWAIRNATKGTDHASLSSSDA